MHDKISSRATERLEIDGITSKLVEGKKQYREGNLSHKLI